VDLQRLYLFRCCRKLPSNEYKQGFGSHYLRDLLTNKKVCITVWPPITILTTTNRKSMSVLQTEARNYAKAVYVEACIRILLLAAIGILLLLFTSRQIAMAYGIAFYLYLNLEQWTVRAKVRLASGISSIVGEPINEHAEKETEALEKIYDLESRLNSYYQEETKEMFKNDIMRIKVELSRETRKLLDEIQKLEK
jgi:hypothetical protein